jgi:ABC-2 type transport system permease protein
VTNSSSTAAALAPESPVRGRLLPLADEARLFWRLRRRMLINMFRLALEHSRLRLSLVVLLTALLWLGLFMLFADGFEFLRITIHDPIIHAETVRAVYGVFFTALTVMLIFSTGVILYGSLYRSAEAHFLLTLPARSERIFLHKFQEAVLFSSWGFLLLGSPLLVAQGVVEDAQWPYFVMLAPYMAAFVYIPGSLGAILCLAIVRFFPANRTQFFTLTIVGVVVTVFGLGWWLWGGMDGDLLTPTWFQELLGRLQFCQNRLLPSWWLSSGLLESGVAGFHHAGARHALADSVLFLALMISNALFFQQVAIWTAGRIYRRGFSALHCERTSRRGRRAVAWIDQLTMKATAFLQPELRLLIVKDLRLFRRDPVQWSQILIFVGLLGLYFFSTRRLTYDHSYARWVNIIGFLNLAVVGLILSTFTTRFIFPLISLEGRRLWILGLLPVRRETILWAKFLFASLGSLVPCALLMVLSDLMLEVSSRIVLAHLLACGMLSMGLSGIAVGLGAKMPNLREESPSRIAAGFGGTLNLVISSLFVVGVVVLTGVACHDEILGPSASFSSDHWSWLAVGTGGCLALGLMATYVPLRLGFKAFRELEI